MLAVIGLHNWLKKHYDSQKIFGCIYGPPGYTDYEDCHGILLKGIWMSRIIIPKLQRHCAQEWQITLLSHKENYLVNMNMSEGLHVNMFHNKG